MQIVLDIVTGCTSTSKTKTKKSKKGEKSSPTNITVLLINYAEKIRHTITGFGCRVQHKWQTFS